MPGYAHALSKADAERFKEDAKRQGWTHVKIWHPKRFPPNVAPYWKVIGRIPKPGFVRKNNPGSVKLPRTGHTGFLKAKAVDVITRNGRVVEVRVKR